MRERPLPRRRLAAVLLAVAGPVLAGCVADGPAPDEAVEPDDPPPIVSVTVPPERLTPFCQAMIDLADRLETDPPDDVAALIVETYEEVLDEVPAEIATEFAAVLDDLRSGFARDPEGAAPSVPITLAADGPLSTEGDEFYEEGYLPDDDPARRVNAYVQFACRDTANNPGPPPTQPLDDVVVADTAAG